MEDVRHLLATGIPTRAAVLGTVVNTRRFGACTLGMRRRCAGLAATLDGDFDRRERRLAGLEARADALLEQFGRLAERGK